MVSILLSQGSDGCDRFAVEPAGLPTASRRRLQNKRSHYEGSARREKDRIGRQGIPAIAFHDPFVRLACGSCATVAVLERLPLEFQRVLQRDVQTLFAYAGKSFHETRESGSWNPA
jgi:hypothetical protein